MPGWDYLGNGYYFITMVIQDRRCLFGKIENDKMIFSVIGRIAQEEWDKSFEIRKELFLDEFIFMPNHIHAIVIIKNNHKSGNSFGLDGARDADGARPCVPTDRTSVYQF
ncbi:MAG: transposase [Bacteroidales bacterium]|nr:transposase [Bacteroidales bacterium]MCF8390817.1 transposase [Bacteroidales bacterium]